MCLFPLPNYMIDSDAYRKGVTKFNCGACPECLSARASRIMVRDVFEASQHVNNCMVTLTYDQYIRDFHGKIIGERVANRSVDKRDVQLFIKRLRMYVWRHFKVRIKYRLSAEYGKKTHRPHYHALIFGFTFPDCVKYKKSKRGNWIYTSAKLTELWRFGICTVDSIRISPAVARYCSKYTSKDHGAEDTFSLCSQGIGLDAMYQSFNGLCYTVEGRQYPIPREIWQRYIIDCYGGGPFSFSTQYVNYNGDNWNDFLRSRRLRKAYRIIRDRDPLYQQYLKFWSHRIELADRLKPSVIERIRALPDSEYFFYKQAALKVFEKRKVIDLSYPAPRSGCKSAWERFQWEHFKIAPVTCRISSRLNMASDTLQVQKRSYVDAKCLFKKFKSSKIHLRLFFDDGDNPFDEKKV